MSNENELFEEIPILSKLIYYKNYHPIISYKFDDKVQCMRCYSRFVFNEFRVIREKNGKKEFIVCKNYPSCNGTLIDFMPAL